MEVRRMNELRVGASTQATCPGLRSGTATDGNACGRLKSARCTSYDALSLHTTHWPWNRLENCFFRDQLRSARAVCSGRCPRDFTLCFAYLN